MSGVSGSGVTWYALLGVDQDASPERIKAAWRDATDRFEPGSGTGQFSLFNEAADVLLDPARRAAYDAQLAREGDAGTAPTPTVVLDPTPEPVPALVLDEQPPVAATAPEADRKAPGAAGRPFPLWLMGVVTVLAVAALALGGLFWSQHRDHEKQVQAGQEASAAAERALPVVLSYDYRHLSADRDRAARFLSTSYRKEYTATFDKLIRSGSNGGAGPAEQTKAVVRASVENIGVVDAQDDVAKVVVFLNQATVKAGGTPKYSLNRLTVSMVRSGNTWQIDKINSY